MLNSRTLTLSKALRSFTTKKLPSPQQRCLSTLHNKSKSFEVGKKQDLHHTTQMTTCINRNFSSSVSVDGNFLSFVEDGLRTIMFNRETKANSLTIPMFFELRDVLKEAADDPNTAITAITGKGRFYSAGFDLVNYGTEPTVELAETLYRGLKSLTAEIIEFPKPLIGLVNGPSAGIMVAYLGLMDAVYASDKATFLTPYSALGIVVEGCASFTFPLIMGRGLATEMLLFNKKMNASEAHQCGLVTELYPADSFMEETNKKLKRLTKLPKKQVQLSKSIITHANKKMLHEINELESRGIQENALSPEFIAAIKKFTNA